MVAEIANLRNGDELALWAQRQLPAKNTMTGADARVVEAAYQAILGASIASETGATDVLGKKPTARVPVTSEPSDPAAGAEVGDRPPRGDRQVTPLRKEIRRRNKVHLAFVAAQPCLVCQRSPCDAHHLKFAQPQALGRKVSDEFTVPLCRDHHQELHRNGNERAWWANYQITALEIAQDLWRQSPQPVGLQVLDPVRTCALVPTPNGRNNP